jgi:ATP-dependent Clp protease protease subunit
MKIKNEDTPLDEIQEDEESYAADLSSGIFMITGPLDSTLSNSVTQYIIEACLEKSVSQLTLIINSPGGDLSAAFAIISIIRSSTIPVTTIAMGDCASGGLMIFMAGAVRYIDKNTSVLSHQLSGSYPYMAKAIDIKARHENLKLNEAKIEQLYAECTGLDMKTIRSKLLTPADVFLTAEECIKYNIADDYYENMNVFIKESE